MIINNIVKIRRKLYIDGKGLGYYAYKKFAKKILKPNEFYIIDTNIGPMYLMDGRDSLMNTIFWSGSHYELGVIKLLEKVVKPEYTVLDIGGHIGYFALLLSKLVGVNGKVITFEPQELLNNFIKENLKLNNVENCKVERVLISNQIGDVEFNESPDFGHSSISHAILEKKEITTTIKQSTTLDNYVANNLEDLDFIKLDVEGAEYLILNESSKNALTKYKPALLIEMHNKQIEQMGGNVASLITFLENIGYIVKEVDEKTGDLSHLENINKSNWHIFAQSPSNSSSTQI